MKVVAAALVCIATLFGIDRILFKGSYVAALTSRTLESAAHFHEGQ